MISQLGCFLYHHCRDAGLVRPVLLKDQIQRGQRGQTIHEH